MAGSVTITDQNFLDKIARPVRKVTLTWVSDSEGAVSGTQTGYLSGTLARVVFLPDTGDTQPSNAYDVTLLDESGVDVLAAQGADLSNSAASAVCPGVEFTDGDTAAVAPCVIDDRLELRVAAAGATNGGRVILYLR